ncbi:MAG: extracellular solute-binding protein [Candidatus Dormibacteria bacterium]
MSGLRPLLALGAGVAMLLAGCSGPAQQAAPRGAADVAFAGSLELVMDQLVGPAFTKATGYQYQGRGAGSVALAQEILAHEISPNVFISVGSAPISLLEPAHTSWAVRIATSPLVLAYYPKGPHAAELHKLAAGQLPIQDLFSLLATPGFRLGRTDPATDPQGQAFAMMVELARQAYSLPASEAQAVLGGSNPGSQIYPETALEAQLQAGQLDAASAFRSQAIQLGLPYVPLPAGIDFGDPQDQAQYGRASLQIGPHDSVHGFLLDLEVTVLGRSDGAAADAFVRYLISQPGQNIFRHAGYSLLPPTLLGNLHAVPASIRAVA